MPGDKDEAKTEEDPAALPHTESTDPHCLFGTSYSEMMDCQRKTCFHLQSVLSTSLCFTLLWYSMRTAFQANSLINQNDNKAAGER